MIYITKDTDERVEYLAPANGHLDNDGYSITGYEWQEAAAETGWVTVPSWGKGGWDAGQWPYVMVAIAKGIDENGTFFGMTTYCEGDLETTFYRTQAAHWEAVSRWCHWNWTNDQGQGPEGLPKDFDECGPEIRRPLGDEYDAVYAAMTGEES